MSALQSCDMGVKASLKAIEKAENAFWVIESLMPGYRSASSAALWREGRGIGPRYSLQPGAEPGSCW